MTYHFKLLTAVALGAWLWLANPVVTKEARAQDVAAPSTIEREFWTSTQQIGTQAAYQAYLSRFPNGFFSPLASAAILKGTTTVSPPANHRSSSRELTQSPQDISFFDAAKIAGPTGSSAITQQTGDVFYGPGPITVGWLGAKKQILIPAGPWVLLGATDTLSGHASPIPLTSLVLAKLDATAFRSFLFVRFNSKTGNPRSNWSDAKTCEESRPSAPFAWVDNGSSVTQCVTSYLLSKASASKMFSAPTWKAPLQALTLGGGTIPNEPYLVTDLFYTGDSSHYMKISRIDFGVVADSATATGGAKSQTAMMDVSIAGRRKWAEVYSALAAPGYLKKLSDNELDAGTKPTKNLASLPQ
jgi:hypothetical protein